ncbi:hypothetical protein DFH06DRAFT_1240614 [Mycena polygramma]|nr:hypothetical protein DFH06DRAFT_1240614 [Mycena polygramma]
MRGHRQTLNSSTEIFLHRPKSTALLQGFSFRNSVLLRRRYCNFQFGSTRLPHVELQSPTSLGLLVQGNQSFGSSDLFALLSKPRVQVLLLHAQTLDEGFLCLTFPFKTQCIEKVPGQVVVRIRVRVKVRLFLLRRRLLYVCVIIALFSAPQSVTSAVQVLYDGLFFLVFMLGSQYHGHPRKRVRVHLRATGARSGPESESRTTCATCGPVTLV